MGNSIAGKAGKENGSLEVIIIKQSCKVRLSGLRGLFMARDICPIMELEL